MSEISKNWPSTWNLSDYKKMAADENAGDWIAVLPLGATEQHGPHLPFETDTLIAQGIVDRLKSNLSMDDKITFLPVEPIGYSPEHLDFKGSKSLAYDEAIDRWIGIGEKLSSMGVRKLVLLNAHGGNSPLMMIVATELRVRFNMLCVATSWTRFGKPEGMFSEAVLGIDIHGGDIETSVMLTLCPEKVNMNSAENFTSEQSNFANIFSYLRAYGKHSFGWKMQDLNPKGVVGNAGNATAEKGEKLLSHSIDGLLKLLDDVKKFDLKQFEQMSKN